MNERQPIVFSRELDRAVTEADPDDLIMNNLDLATRVALWFWRRKTKEVPLEELQAQALLTLVEVVQGGKLDDIKDFKKYVMQAMYRNLFGMVQRESGMRIPQNRFRDVDDLRKIEDADRMTDAEVCAALGWTQRRLNSTRRALVSLSGHVSLGLPINDEGDLTLGDILPDSTPGPEEAFLNKLEKEEAREEIRAALAGFSPAIQRALSFRFGIPVPGLEKIALRELVALANNRSITSRGIQKLRKEVLGDGVVPSSAGSPFDGIHGGNGSRGGTRKSVAFEKWRYYSKNPAKWLPALKPAGSMGN